MRMKRNRNRAINACPRPSACADHLGVEVDHEVGGVAVGHLDGTKLAFFCTRDKSAKAPCRVGPASTMRFSSRRGPHWAGGRPRSRSHFVAHILVGKEDTNADFDWVSEGRLQLACQRTTFWLFSPGASRSAWDLGGSLRLLFRWDANRQSLALGECNNVIESVPYGAPKTLRLGKVTPLL
jgi:hypothetical protein